MMAEAIAAGGSVPAETTEPPDSGEGTGEITEPLTERSQIEEIIRSTKTLLEQLEQYLESIQ